MTTHIKPLIHRDELDLLGLMAHVPEHDLGNYDALIHAALRDELEQAGYTADDLQLGEIHDDDDVEFGCAYLVHVSIDGQPHAGRVVALFNELAAICVFRDRVTAFAENAMERLKGPGQEVRVVDHLQGAGDRIGLWIVDDKTDEVVWSSQPLATATEVLAAIDDEVERRTARKRSR